MGSTLSTCSCCRPERSSEQPGHTDPHRHLSSVESGGGMGSTLSKCSCCRPERSSQQPGHTTPRHLSKVDIERIRVLERMKEGVPHDGRQNSPRADHVPPIGTPRGSTSLSPRGSTSLSHNYHRPSARRSPSPLSHSALDRKNHSRPAGMGSYSANV